MREPRELAIHANGLRFQGLAWPDGGPLALLVHATSFCADVWRPVWSAAQDVGGGAVRAVAVDQRGHGASDAPSAAADYAWTHLAEDLVALVEALAADDRAPGVASLPALLIGH